MKLIHDLPTVLLACLLLHAAAPGLSAQAPANDQFANAIALPGTSGGSTTGNSRNATVEVGEPDPFGYGTGKSVWWKWTAPVDGRFVLHTAGSAFDTLLALYTGTELNDLVLVDSNDQAMGGNQSRITFVATAGVTYFISVDGFGLKGFGAIKLAWMFQPTLVYTWREEFSTEGAEAFYDENDVLEDIEWYPKATFVETGLIVRGRSSDTTLPLYGDERGPVAKFTFFPVKVGGKTVRYFTITPGKPIVVTSAGPGVPDQVFGGYYSTMTQYKRSPATVREDVSSEFYELDDEGSPNYLGGFYVGGKATRKVPFAGAAKTWFASTLKSDFSFASPIDTGDTPDQGEPEFGSFNRIKQTLLFSPTYTSRVKYLDFDAAVAAIRQRLIDTGAIEGEPPP